MSKSIKVSDTVYQALLEQQLVRETFNDVIRRLLRVADIMEKVLPLVHEKRDELLKKVQDIEQTPSPDR